MNVLVQLTGDFTSEEQKKLALEKQRLEVSRSVHNAVIQFVFSKDKNAEKIVSRYKKKHRKAVEIIV